MEPKRHKAEIIKGTLLYQGLEVKREFCKLAGLIYKGLRLRSIAGHYFDRARQIKRQQIEMLNW